jgi:hypothetical protein
MLRNIVLNTTIIGTTHCNFGPIASHPRQRCEQQTVTEWFTVKIQSKALQCRTLRTMDGESISWNHWKLPPHDIEWQM